MEEKNVSTVIAKATRLRRVCEQINNIEGALSGRDEARAARGLLLKKAEEAHGCVVDILLVLEARSEPEANDLALLEALRESGLAASLGSMPQTRLPE